MEPAGVCDTCSESVPPGAAFCPSCGAPREPRCPQCGAPVHATNRFCPACGHKLDVVAAEERKLITAVFVDLVGSTALGERLDPEMLRLVLSRYFAEMTGIVESWGGTVAKYVGDAVLAVFGAPRSHGDDADRALHAALAMADHLTVLNQELEADQGIRLVTRTGVNTGEVVVADVDSVVLGDVMNTAARLEQAAPPGTILVGARTAANLTTPFQLEPVADLVAKGKTDPVAAYRLTGRPVLVGRRPIAELVGRERPLRLLATHLEQVKESASPFLVTVIGDAGIGKSTLVGAFAQANSSGGVEVVTAGCLPYGEGFASWPLREMLHDLAGITLDDDTSTAGAKFRAFIHQHLDDEPLLHALAIGAGIDLADNPLARAPAETVRSQLSVAWPRLLSALVRAGPLLLVMEDVHWSEPDLISMLDRIVLRTSGPLMIVCTARPDFDESGFGPRTPHARLVVPPLDEQEKAEITAHLLPGLSADEAASLVAAAGGNPFFMEEIVGHLAGTGILRQVDGVFQVVGNVGSATLPDTVRALLGARIDALQPEAKDALMAASVVGTTFWAEALAGMVDSASLESALEVLEAEGHILPDPGGRLPGHRQIAFRHDLVREVAYGSISRGRAARYHAYFADWVEERVGDRRSEFVDLVALHRSVAAESRQLGWPEDRDLRETIRKAAVDALLEASGAALRRSAWEESLRLVDRAERLAVSPGERGSIGLERARTRRAVDLYTEAWQDYLALIALAEAESLDQLRSDAVIESVLMVGQMGGGIDESHGWRRWLVETVDLRLAPALTAGRLEEAAALSMARGALFFWQIEGTTAEESLTAAAEAVRLARLSESDRVMGPAMDLLVGVTLMIRGLGEAVALVDEVIAVADAAPDRVVANELYTTAQWTLIAAGDIERARAIGERHLVEATLLGTHTRVHSHRGVAELALATGDLAAVIAGTGGLLDLVEEDGGRVCDHGAAALSARALALAEAGEERGLTLFDDLEGMAIPKAQFTAHIANLERKRPFIPLREAEAALSALEEPRYLSQAAARAWVAVPLAVQVGDASRLEEEVAGARRLGSDSADRSLVALADWGEALLEAGRGRAAAPARAMEALERLASSGRAYTSWRLGVDTAHTLSLPPVWAEELAAKLAAGGAHRSADELRNLVS
jgi:class 3 adenylate cyclase